MLGQAADWYATVCIVVGTILIMVVGRSSGRGRRGRGRGSSSNRRRSGRLFSLDFFQDWSLIQTAYKSEELSCQNTKADAVFILRAHSIPHRCLGSSS